MDVQNIAHCTQQVKFRIFFLQVRSHCGEEFRAARSAAPPRRASPGVTAPAGFAPRPLTNDESRTWSNSRPPRLTSRAEPGLPRAGANLQPHTRASVRVLYRLLNADETFHVVHLHWSVCICCGDCGHLGSGGSAAAHSARRGLLRSRRSGTPDSRWRSSQTHL